MSDFLSCAAVLDQVEAIAAGDIPVDDTIRAHLESCPRCASTLAAARRIEESLAARPAPPAPARFRHTVLARIRRERWMSEQRVDRIFNLAIAAAVLLMFGGVAALLNVDRVLATATAIGQFAATTAAPARDVRTPGLAAYVGSIGLFVSALGTWWWAERRLSF